MGGSKRMIVTNGKEYMKRRKRGEGRRAEER